jgi:biopolymer transport protein ExbD
MVRSSTLFLVVLSMAVVLALSAPAVAAEAKGTIKTVTADKNEFVMTDANAKDWTMNVNKDAKVFVNDKESKLSDLQASDAVTITYEKVGDRLNVSEIKCKRK